MNGYWGKVLEVDLTTRTIKVLPLPEDRARDFIGGVGLAARIMYDEIPAGADALGPENVLVSSTGPLQGGSRILDSGRFSMCAESPLTGIFGKSTGDGHNAEEFNKAGFDALVVKGKAAEPVYIFIHDGQVEIRDALHLLGCCRWCSFTLARSRGSLPPSAVRAHSAEVAGFRRTSTGSRSAPRSPSSSCRSLSLSSCEGWLARSRESHASTGGRR